MNRIDAIIRHPVFRKNIKECGEAESERIFCHHDMSHFLDVARLMWIYTLEAKLSGEIPEEELPDREIVYAAALLHDIGRIDQLRDGIPHERAGAVHAAAILEDCGFSVLERELICRAIGEHRRRNGDAEFRRDILSEFLYRADKRSRPCHSCRAEPECDWDAGKKNMKIDF